MIVLDKIIGTSHPNYHGMSWISLFDIHLKSISSLYCISNTPNVLCDVQYYIGDSKQYKKFDWGINIINESDGYIVGGGNHRTVIAKFLAKAKLIPNEIILPSVTYIYCDIDALTKYRTLQRDIDEIKIKNNHVEYLSIDLKQIVLEENDHSKTFLIEYYLNIKIKKHQRYTFNDIDELINFMTEHIEKHKSKILSLKLLKNYMYNYYALLKKWCF